jgi:hypothetical protein
LGHQAELGLAWVARASFLYSWIQATPQYSGRNKSNGPNDLRFSSTNNNTEPQDLLFVSANNNFGPQDLLFPSEYTKYANQAF